MAKAKQAAKPQRKDNRKAELFSEPVEHIDVKTFDARPIVEAWSKMSFTSRDSARAAEILNMALADKGCSLWLTLAGSTSAGGCMHVWRDMIEHNMVDAIVDELRRERRVRVGIGVDRHGGDAHLATGAEDATRDLAAVRDDELPDDRHAAHIRNTPKPRRPCTTFEWHADSAIPSTERVWRGSMTPSS